MGKKKGNPRPSKDCSYMCLDLKICIKSNALDFAKNGSPKNFLLLEFCSTQILLFNPPLYPTVGCFTNISIVKTIC